MLLDVLVLTAASGCYLSHERPEESVPLEGPRLRPVELVTEDGAAQPAGFYDRLLGVDCTFAHDEAGAWRCLPTDADAVRYEDPECTRPVMQIGFVSEEHPPCAHPPFARESHCDHRTTVYEPTGTRVVDRIYTDLGGCHETSVPGAQVIVADLARVEPTRFVGATEDSVPAGVGVLRQTLTTDEGARYPVGPVWDRDLGSQCGLLHDDREAGRRTWCAALGAVSYRPFGCDASFALDPAECPATPGALASASTIDACGVRAAALGVIGPPITADEVTAMGCDLVFDTGPLRFIEPVPLSRAAELEVRREGGGRLHPIAYASDGGEPFHDGVELWDDELGIPCIPQRVAGELRCVPQWIRYGFVDGPPTTSSGPDCAIPALTETTARMCEREYIVFLHTCGDGWDAVYEKGERSDHWYRDDRGACRPATGAPGDTVRLLEETHFARLERVVR